MEIQNNHNMKSLAITSYIQYYPIISHSFRMSKLSVWCGAGEGSMSARRGAQRPGRDGSTAVMKTSEPITSV